MAITAAITLSASTVTSNQTPPSQAALTVTNTGANAVLVTGIAPTVVPHGQTPQSVAVGVGVAAFGGAFAVSVPGSSGTLVFNFPVQAFAPTTTYGLAEPTQYQYDVGATVYTNDGSITAATTATLTVNNPALS
jgi:hypothetical protein